MSNSARTQTVEGKNQLLQVVLSAVHTHTHTHMSNNKI